MSQPEVLPVCPICGERVAEHDRPKMDDPVQRWVGPCHSWCAEETRADLAEMQRDAEHDNEVFGQ